MATLKTLVPSLVFPYELDNISIQQTDKDNVRVTFEIGGSVVFDNTLYFDKEGSVNIFQVADFLRTYIKRDAKTVRILLDDVAAATTTCIPCNIRMTEKAEEFCPNHFLSLGGPYIFTTRNGRVYFSFYCDGTAETATITNRKLVDGAIVEEVVKTANYNKKGIVNFYLDMAEIHNADNILSTVLKVGEREARIHTYKMDSPNSMTIVFGNAFNQLETFNFSEVETKMNPKFDTAMVCGLQKNIRVHREREYKCIAGILAHGEPPVFEDLAESIAVYRYPGMQPLVITAVDYKKTSDYHVPTKGSITFRDTDSLPVYQPYREPQTFDATFDNTFK